MTDPELVAACLAGDPAAQGALRERLVALSARALRRFDDVTEGEEEVAQLLWLHLIGVGRDRPALADWSGQGTLDPWLRVAISRQLLNLRRSRHREDLVDEVPLPDLGGPPVDPLMKAEISRIFKETVQEAVLLLSDRERALLRDQLIDGLSIDDLAAKHQVHRATTARWLDRARSQLRDQTLARLRDRLRVEDQALQSLLRAVETGMDASLTRVLRES